MRKQIQDFFTFSSGEKAGIFTLSVIILSLIGMLYFTEQINNALLPSKEEISLLKSQFQQELEEFKRADSLRRLNEKREEVIFAQSSDSLIDESNVKSIPTFNPNEFTLEIGDLIGLSEKQSQSILNYINKGGVFRKKEDFKKMYVISSEKYEELEPYILLPDVINSKYLKEPSKDYTKSNDTKPKPIVIANLNIADSATLVKVKGIGPYYAKSIVKYRDELGGFVSKKQLLEIYGMDEERFLKLDSLLILPIAEPYRKLNVNTITIDELKNHPYFDWNLSRSLVNYRDNHGKFKSIEDLKKLRLIDAELYRKIAPYITL